MKTSEIVLSVVLVLLIILIIKQENPLETVICNSLTEMIYGVKHTENKLKLLKIHPSEREPWRICTMASQVDPEEPHMVIRIPADSEGVSNLVKLILQFLWKTTWAARTPSFRCAASQNRNFPRVELLIIPGIVMGFIRLRSPKMPWRWVRFPGRPVEQFFSHPSNYALNSHFPQKLISLFFVFYKKSRIRCMPQRGMKWLHTDISCADSPRPFLWICPKSYPSRILSRYPLAILSIPNLFRYRIETTLCNTELMSIRKIQKNEQD